jgi:formylglycine-generating enzyme required for sulfatase activity
MLKLSKLLSIAAVCLAMLGCRPAEQSLPKTAVPTKNAPINATLESSAKTNLVAKLLILPAVDKTNLSESLVLADAAFAAARYEDISQKRPAALEWYLAILQFDANNLQAQSGLEKTIAALIEKTRQATVAGNLTEAARMLQVLELSLVQDPEMNNLRSQLAKARQADLWQQKAIALEKRKNILSSSVDKKNGGAVAAYRKALVEFPDYKPAVLAIDRLRNQREIAALSLAKKEKFQAALIALNQAALVDNKNPHYQTVARHVYGRLNQSIQAKTVLANLALDGLRIKPAQVYYLQAETLLPKHPEVIALAKRLDEVKHYARFKPHQFFSDAWAMSSPAPEMVVVPYGRFEMGAPLSLVSAPIAELPRRTVVFKRGFAIARSEITVGQFRQFIESSGYQTRATARGWSMVFDEKGGSMTKRDNIDWHHDHLGRVAKDELPVVHVTLVDAQAYAEWLSKKTGVTYRLPSEAEFEYVLRAGSNTIYPWGDQTPDKVVANLAGAGDKSTQSRSWGNAIPGYRDFHWGAAPVRSFKPEPWGSFDMSGNVEEWVQDCWHDSYQRAPSDSSAWVNPGCKMGITRGASWASSLDEARVSFRTATLMKTHNARIGFRVVRAL